VNQVFENKAVKKQLAVWMDKIEKYSRSLNVYENKAT